jgi:hypothetical protein
VLERVEYLPGVTLGGAIAGYVVPSLGAIDGARGTLRLRAAGVAARLTLRGSVLSGNVAGARVALPVSLSVAAALRGSGRPATLAQTRSQEPAGRRPDGAAFRARPGCSRACGRAQSRPPKEAFRARWC